MLELIVTLYHGKAEPFQRSTSVAGFLIFATARHTYGSAACLVD